MKKSLLLGSAILIGVGAFAQTNRQVLSKKLASKATRYAAIEKDGLSTSTSRSRNVAHNINPLSTSISFASSRNGFGMLVEETVPLSYNADLNMVAFTHRIGYLAGTPVEPNFPDNTTGITAPNSGHMMVKYSTNNGTTWNAASLFTASAANVGGAAARYPSGVIANAPGNTNASEARFVGTGPCTGGSGWMANWFASRPASDTGNTMLNDMQVAPTAIGSGSVAENTYFSSFSTTNNGTDVWTSGYAYESTGNDIMAIAVYKGVKDSTGAYSWTRPIDALLNNFLDSSYFSSPKIAFSPNGQIGYIVINGVWASNTGNARKSYNPNVWKTTDGGLTWNKVNDNYDWKTNHPEILGNIRTTAYDGCWDGSGINRNYPAFHDKHGGEITVDNTGKLHYVTTVVPAYSSNPDSLGYQFSNPFGYLKNEPSDRPWVWDFTTDGNGTWDTKYITDLYTRNIETDDIVGVDAFWTTDVSTALDYTNRIKVSRTNDGSKVFMTWTDSDINEFRPDTIFVDTTTVVDTILFRHIPNKAPSLFYKGLDVATGNLSVTDTAYYFDSMEGGFYLHSTSEIVIKTDSSCIIPTIYMVSSDGNRNAANPVDYSYIPDLEILDNAYTVSSASNTAPIASADFRLNVDTMSTLAVSITTLNNVLCYGACNGSVRADKSGSVVDAPPSALVSYTWSNNKTTQTITNLCAGTYIVQAKSSYLGCVAFDTIQVTQPDSLSIATLITNSTCGDSTGAVSLNVTGGTGSYTYTWNNSPNAAIVDSLPAGVYNVQVKDANNCTKLLVVLLNDTGAPVLNPSVTNVTCFGSSNGSISANATGGTGPLTYSWNAGLDTNAVLTGAAAGTYSLVVKDSLNCSAVSSLIITQPTALTLNLTSTQSCYAQCSGSINSTVSGGLGTYAYSWSNNSTSANLTSLCPGSYILIVRDSADLTCLIADTISVTQRDSINTNVSNTAGFGTILQAQQTAGPGIGFKWLNCANNVQVGTARSYTATVNGSYKVVVTVNGCSDTSACIIVDAVGLKDLQSTIEVVSQNMPNPFATTSVINVTLSKSEVITLNVTNLAGQVVLSKVVKGNRGVNEITIDAINLESGIYFYNVNAGDSKVTRKMSVVK